MGLSFYRKYGNFPGHLSEMIKNGKVPHAFVIEADSTFDKEGLAKAAAQALVCRQMPGEGCGRCVECRKIKDETYEALYIVRPADTTEKKTGTLTIKDAQVEDLQARLKTRPEVGEHNIAIIESGGTMTRKAQTRFLKTLEEPPEGTVIMILTENSEELLPTINSRCVNARLCDPTGTAAEPPEGTRELLALIAKKAYFRDILDHLGGMVKTRSDAYELLDGAEALIGKAVRRSAGAEGESPRTAIGPEAAKQAVRCIEKTRRDIKLGASHNYMLRKMILDLEDIIS